MTQNKNLSNSPKKKEGQSEQVAPLPLEQLPSKVRDLVQKLPVQDRGEAIKLFMMKTTTAHSGPIPDPDTLDRYNSIIPGAGERILVMAENQQNHRMEMEKTSLRRQYNQSGTGQWMAYTIALSFLGASVYVGMHDHDILAGILGGTTVVGLVTTFIAGKLKIGKSLNEKKPE
jgi:uncharacterized membrane protein